MKPRAESESVAGRTVVLVGDGAVLARCGEVLLADGYRIAAVVTGDAAIRGWAVKSGIVYHGRADAVAEGTGLHCDLLLSIGNRAVVPDELLACASRMSINYHYGPLPRYSGLNAPSWAIADRVTEYAITWHVMDARVDGGDVLESVPVPIRPDDTALSLGVKCDDAAVASVAGLVRTVVEGRERRTPQDPAQRRYFSRHTQLDAEGLIDWSRPADEIVARVRATQYGAFDSPLVWVKIAVGDTVLAVRGARAGTPDTAAAPGEIVACDDERGLEVATSSGTVLLTDVCLPEGGSRDVATLGVRPGQTLSAPDERTAERITEAGRAASKADRYWRERLLGTHPFRLPFGPPRTDGSVAPVVVDCGPVGGRIADVAGAWCTFLGRATGEHEITVAVRAPVPDAGPLARELFGGWVPLRARVEPGSTLARNRAAVAAEYEDGQRRGPLRRDAVGRDDALRRLWASGPPMSDVLITDGDSAGPGSGHGAALELVVAGDAGTVEFRFDPARVCADDVARLAGQFGAWCERVPSADDRPFTDVSALSAEEYAAVVTTPNATGDDTTTGHCLHRLVEQTARRCPDGVALVCGERELTYRELDAAADGLAAVLHERGARRGERVGVAVDRSTDLVVTLLAVLKTGAAYVPIDPNFPAERIRLMLDDAAPALVVTSSASASLAAASGHDVEVLALDTVDTTGGAAAPAVDVAPTDLAYVIYTSGSTGRPKGVEITHDALGNFLLSMRAEPGCTPDDRLLAITTISFDIAALELFLPLVCGATTVIAGAHETADAAALFALMGRHGITIMQGTPATWQLLLDSGWHGEPALATLLCGGEALPGPLADRLLAAAGSGAVWNMYGPTETTVWSSVWRVEPDADVVVGHPIANTRIHVLGPDLAPVPVGFPGELCIGGAGVARGYRLDPERTAERFVEDPFGDGVLYRTGDRARYLAPGRLAVLGRADDQVKLRGHRIELGDVESAITAHDGIARAVVVGRDDQLVAYCVRAPGETAGTRDAVLSGWAGAWDTVYSDGAADAEFNLAGWVNSYDGLPFGAGEMRDWQSASVRAILAHSPDRVLEIGSGSGLMLFAVAPHCSRYHAVDASERAVAGLRAHVGALPQVTVEHRPAHDLPDVERGAFDTVVINSVAQYFPDVEYLTSVIGWATDALADGGRIVLGDLRDLSLLEVFHADLADFRHDGALTADDLADRAVRGALADRELVVAREFFATLPSAFPSITAVDVTLRGGHHVNEMTRYRFDVTLHVGAPAGNPVPAREQGWSGEVPAVTAGEAVRITGVGNGRLADVRRRVGSALGHAPAVAGAPVDPQELLDAARSAGLHAAALPAASGDPWALDVVVWAPGDRPDLSPAVPAEPGRSANVPAAAESTRAPLNQVLRPWLADRLPGYMVPAFFVELDELPLTPNGKVDRSALPDPVIDVVAVAKPATELESDIATAWAAVLGHDRFGITDNFFEVGGDSLRVVRLQAELERALGRPVWSAKLYEHYTIRALAADLAGATTTVAEPVPARRRLAEDDDIAIVAMACRLPGEVRCPEDYWDLLARGGDGIVEVPKERWDADAVYDADPEAAGMSYCRFGGFVAPIDLFDASFFGVSPREARSLEPSQRMVLETVWEAFERAGYTMDRLRGSDTGAFIGVGKSSAYHEYGLTAAGTLHDLDGYVGPGSAGGTMSGRVSYVFGLEGPTMTVDTACSSSLVTTHLACSALRQGECDLAVAAGVSLMLNAELHVEFSRLRGMSPDGRCRSFSEDTEGTGWSEGSTAVVLKRLSDAERDGDPILAVLRGTAVNHDGHAASLTTPSGPAQRKVIRSALSAAGLQPGDIDYVEAHGTGTKLGDPIEGTALAQVFGGSRADGEPLWIGSAKSNLGHTQAAAGLAGVMKVVLAMQHETLPRTLHVSAPTPAVDWDGAGLALVREERAWPRRDDRPRRAGVSSFGIGGTNSHVVIEEPPVRVAPGTASVPLPPTVPLLLSGVTEGALRHQAEQLHGHMGMNIADRVGDIAGSLATTRSHFRKRLVVPVRDKSELLDKLGSFARTGELPAGAIRSEGQVPEPCVAMLFTGQGSQLPGMGRSVYDAFPVFREAVDEIVAHFDELDRPLLDVMWAEPGSAEADLLNRTDFTQPALFTLEVALWRLWTSWGVHADALLGHSIGELAAAHVAGVFDLADACRLVAARGRLMQALPGGSGHGAMASLEAGADEVAAAVAELALSGRVDVAGLNTPSQTVVSGDADAVEALSGHVSAQGRKAKALTVSHAFHSHHMEPMLDAFREVAESVRYAEPTLRMVSSRTGLPAAPGEMQTADYWVGQVRDAVRFSDGMTALAGLGATTFLELGPQPTLSGMGAACLADSATAPAWVPSLVSGRDGASVVQEGLARLHVRDVPVDWAAWFAPFGTTRVALPTYAFQRERYWFEPPAARAVGAGLDDTDHALLGGGVAIAGTQLHVFTNVVSDTEPAWARDHDIMGAVLLPGTAFFEAMRAAGTAAGRPGSDLADVVIVSPLVLRSGVPVRFQTTVGPASGDARPVQVYSLPEGEDGQWQLHAEGRIVAADGAVADRSALPPATAETLDVSALYDDLAALGYGYGPTFQGIREAWHVGGEVWARVALPEGATAAAARFGLHPALLDSAMHSLLLTQRLANTSGEDLFVPYEAERLSLRREGLSEIWVHVVDFEMGDGEFWASLDIYDPSGEHVGRLHRLHARRIDRAALRRLAATGVDRFQFDVGWNPYDVADVEIGGSWGMLTPAGNVSWAKQLKAGLGRAGLQVIKIADLEDAEDLDGLLCLWDPADSADAGDGVVEQAHELTALALGQLQELAESGFGPPVVWVTRHAVGTATDDQVTGPGAAPLWGMLRTARSEHPELDLRAVDLAGTERAAGDYALLASALMTTGEPECALRDGEVLVPQLRRVGSSTDLELPDDGKWKLEIAAKGRLDEPLRVTTMTERAIGAGEVRAEVRATGVNFLDVLNALGMVEIPAFGIEFAGVATEVGAGVRHVRVGDPVLGLARGSFASEVVVDARQIVVMPEHLTFEQAATIPMTFLTAWYGLHELGSLQPGEKVLVHAAAGGVGMAAVQLARLHGAEVFGTASEPKWDALRELGLDDAHIASSRDLGFVERFGRISIGSAFDVVLNSLATEFIDAGLGLLGSGGRFLEMGKIDVREQSAIDVSHPGVTYTVYNLPEAGPDLIQSMLARIAELFVDGRLTPLPLRTFGMTATSDALRFMAQARHVGKVVLVPAARREPLRSDGAVLVTGGTGDLGRRVAAWLVTEHGVRDLVLTSRRGPDAPDADAAVAALAELGATATVVACDSSDRDGLREIVGGFGGDRPLRGVVHASGVLDDGALSALTPERCETVARPKVDGAWYLHELTRDLDLDLFLMFSSIASIMGAPGQGNYAAANAFLDSLASLRRAAGLPATSVAWGPWEGDGMAAGLSEVDRARFAQLGLDRLTPDEGLELLSLAVSSGRALTMSAALDLTRVERYFSERGGIPPLLRSVLDGSGGGRAGGSTVDLRKLLGESDPAEHADVVLRVVREEVAKTLGFSSPDDVDVTLPLQDIGIDSLTAVLMRNQLADLTGLALPAKIVFDHPDLITLAGFLLSELVANGLDTTSGPAPAAAAPTPAAAPVVVADGGDLATIRKGCLEPELIFDDGGVPPAVPESVFLTGATGFVGAFLLHELLEAEISAYCLVRADDAVAGLQRLSDALAGYGLWKPDYEPLLNPVVGDLSQRLFGLSEPDFDDLADQVDAVLHCGALVDWMRPLEDYLGPNVVGAHEALRLAARGRGTTVHLVSTYATLPRYRGYDVAVDDREYGYLTSKWMAEQMVAAARWRGARAFTYRLPFVAASAGSGHFRADRGDFLHNLVAGGIELGCFPSLPTDLSGVLPVDHLSRTITDVVRDPARTGADHDFVNAGAPTFDEFFALLGAAGDGTEIVGFDEWRERALAHAASHPEGPLARIAAVVDGLTRDDMAGMLSGLPVGPHVFGGADHPAPAVDERYARRYVDRIRGAVGALAGAGRPADPFGA